MKLAFWAALIFAGSGWRLRSDAFSAACTAAIWAWMALVTEAFSVSTLRLMAVSSARCGSSGAPELFSFTPGVLGSEAIKWNFTKFLVGKDGRVLKRYASMDTPAKLAKDIEAALAA